MADIDVPVLVIGVDAEPEEHIGMAEQNLIKAEPEQQDLDLLNS